MRVRVGFSGWLIPARAGNITQSRLNVQPVSAHPRSRGEHKEDPPVKINTRLIPARAGNMILRLRLIRLSTAHPRSRGEHLSTSWKGFLNDGSSPLARGTFPIHPNQRVANRLIPARAGNILLPVALPAPFSAHPRSRGEHSPSRPHGSGVFGSSPLARGTSGGCVQIRTPQRLIPARAGNILESAPMWKLSAAHPRSRGEHVAALFLVMCAPGSSPLARGT